MRNLVAAVIVDARPGETSFKLEIRGRLAELPDLPALRAEGAEAQ